MSQVEKYMQRFNEFMKKNCQELLMDQAVSNIELQELFIKRETLADEVRQLRQEEAKTESTTEKATIKTELLNKESTIKTLSKKIYNWIDSIATNRFAQTVKGCSLRPDGE